MWAILNILAILLAAGGVAMAHFRVSSPIFGFYMVLAGALLSILFFLPAFVVAYKKGGAGPWLSALLGLAALGGGVHLFLEARKHPINDVTTNTAQPPKFVHPVVLFQVEEGREFAGSLRTLTREYKPEMAPIQKARYGELAPAKAPFPPHAEFLAALVKGIQGAFPDWRLVLIDKENFRVEAEAESKLFRFVDDVALEARAVDGATLVELRSRSRDGQSDLGANHKRLQELGEVVRRVASAHQAEWKKIEATRASAPELAPTATVPPKAPPPVPPAKVEPPSKPFAPPPAEPLPPVTPLGKKSESGK